MSVATQLGKWQYAELGGFQIPNSFPHSRVPPAPYPSSHTTSFPPARDLGRSLCDRVRAGAAPASPVEEAHTTLPEPAPLRNTDTPPVLLPLMPASGLGVNVRPPRHRERK